MPVIGTAAAKPGQNWFMSPDYGRNLVREVYTTFEGWPCRHNWHRPILPEGYDPTFEWKRME